MKRTAPRAEVLDGSEKRISAAQLIEIAADLRQKKDYLNQMNREADLRHMSLDDALDGSNQDPFSLARMKGLASSVRHTVGYGVARRRVRQADTEYTESVVAANQELTEFFLRTPHTLKAVDVGVGITQLDGETPVGKRRVDAVTGSIERVDMEYNGSLYVRNEADERFRLDLLTGGAELGVAIDYHT